MPDRLVVAVCVGIGDLLGDLGSSFVAAPFKGTVDAGDDGTQDNAFHIWIGAEPFHRDVWFGGEIKFFRAIGGAVDAAGVDFSPHAALGDVRCPCFGVLNGEGDLYPSAEIFIFDVCHFDRGNAGCDQRFTLQPWVGRYGGQLFC